MSNKAKVWLQTTDVPSMKSVGEIVSEIVQRGATQIHQEFDGNGRAVGLKFLLTLKDGTQIPVDIPARVPAMIAVLKKKILGPKSQLRNQPVKLEEMAFRILWRQKLQWVRSMFAEIDLDQATPEQVFLPYFVDAQGKSLGEAIVPHLQKFAAGEMPFKALAEPGREAE